MGVLLGCPSGKTTDSDGSDGLQLDELHLETLKGEKIDLESYNGKTIFINFWATWCKPCLQEMPSIQKAMSLVNLEEVIFLFPSNETIDEITAFKERRDFPFEYVQVKNLEALNFYALPATLIFNPYGELIFSEVGMRDWATEENLALLQTQDEK